MNQYAELKRSVLSKPTSEMKGKVVRRIRRDIMKDNPRIIMKYMNVGIKDGKIFVIIETDYINAVAIKKVLHHHKMLSSFDVLFKKDATFPEVDNNTNI